MKLTENLYNQVLVKPAFLLLIFFGFYSRTEGFLGLSGGQLSVLISFGFFSLSAFHFLFFRKHYKLSQYNWFITLFFFLSSVIQLVTTFIYSIVTTLFLRLHIII